MKFSILHISDLHRDVNDEVDNSWLIDSLTRDFDGFSTEEKAISKPGLCVVSGDLIFGVSPSHENYDIELKRQYKQVEDFLVSVADDFFGGDRNKVIIIPGNHDVSFPTMLDSAEVVDTPSDNEERNRLVADFFRKNTRLRWSWSDLCFYKIIDREKYFSRFLYFSEMYNSFYQGKRKYSLSPSEQYHVFDFPDLSFCILALNSCFDNDPFNRKGFFNPEAFSKGCRELAEPHRRGWLISATWHHNLAGSPLNQDYLDVEFVQLLIDAGVSVAFHGHQHLSECFDERFRFGGKSRKMTIISAGTLCADSHHLQPGIPRSYNVIELDTLSLKGRVHKREMLNTILQNLPIWGAGIFRETNLSYTDFNICKPLSIRPKSLDLQIHLEEIERLFSDEDWLGVINYAINENLEKESRAFLVKALEEQEDFSKIINILWPPVSNKDVVMIGDALIYEGTIEKCRCFLDLDIVKNNNDPSVCEIKNRLEIRRLR